LHEAQPVAADFQSHHFTIDGHRAFEFDGGWQVVLVQGVIGHVRNVCDFIAPTQAGIGI
jgi:hypothetical protein